MTLPISWAVQDPGKTEHRYPRKLRAGVSRNNYDEETYPLLRREICQEVRRGKEVRHKIEAYT